MNRSKTMAKKYVVPILLIIVAIFIVPLITKATSEEYSDFLVEANSKSKIELNLFDYWITNPEDDDALNMQNITSLGINKNHLLLFTWGGSAGVGSYNRYTGGAKASQNIVKPTLDENGYPVTNIPEDKLVLERNNESLDYLFNPDIDVEYRKVYKNVKGFFRFNDEMGDYYSCFENFAHYNPETNSFSLYNIPAVRGQANFGQFFPFADLNTVFKNQNGTLTDSGKGSGSGDLNHYLGLTIKTTFGQPVNGMMTNATTGKEQAMKATFTGDDDIWIFIDGVLVSDIGGIHAAISTTIDFSTGKVTIQPNDPKKKSASTFYEYYLGEKYEAVANELDPNYISNNLIKETDAEGNITRYTYKDDTIHELKIFYLERGHYDSNLEASFWPNIQGNYQGKEEEEEEKPSVENPPTENPEDEESNIQNPEENNPETSDNIELVRTILCFGILIVAIGIVFKMIYNKNKSKNKL